MPEPDSHALRAAWEPYLPGDMALQGSILMPYIPTVPCRLCPNVGKRARPILLHSRQVCYPFLLVLVSRKPSRYCWPTSFKVLGVLFLGEVCSAFLPSKQACWTYKFRHLGVGQQYPPFSGTKICLNAVCNYRSRNQLYDQSHKFVPKTTSHPFQA
jgi:hypothetical protein